MHVAICRLVVSPHITWVRWNGLTWPSHTMWSSPKSQVKWSEGSTLAKARTTVFQIIVTGRPFYPGDLYFREFFTQWPKFAVIWLLWTKYIFDPRRFLILTKRPLFRRFCHLKTQDSLPTSVQSQQCKDIFKLEVKKHFFSELSKAENTMYIFN